MSKITINLQNQSHVFVAGQSILGTLTLTLSGEQQTGGLFINCDGNGHVHFTKSHSESTRDSKGKSTSKSVSKSHSAHEKYFERQITFFGGTGTPQKMLPGTYNYPFQLDLPLNLPSSFAGYGYGRIEYTLTGIFNQKPWFNFDTTETIPILIRGYFDLNSLPALRDPIHMMNEKTICCCCCASGPIIIKLDIPKSGYVLGEIINFVLEVDNKSSRNFPFMTIGICERTRYNAFGEHNTWFKKHLEIKGPPVPPKSRQVWDSTKIMVPDLPTSPSLSGCHIIELNYSLCGEIQIPGGFNLECDVPIQIGTVPLTDVHVQQPVSRTQSKKTLLPAA